MGVKRGEVFDAQEGGKTQRLTMPQQRLFAVRQQGNVIIRIRVLMGLDGLREVGDNRGNCPLVIEPMRQERPAHGGQMGPHPDDRCARGRRPTPGVVARTALGPIALHRRRNRLRWPTLISMGA